MTVPQTASASVPPFLPPILFAAMWLLVTTIFGFVSGWFALQRRFPGNQDTPLLRLRMRSGKMGWIHLNGILTLDSCASGLRVSVWKLFGPFQRPFQVPWDQIEAEPVAPFLLGPIVRLRFGRPEVGRLAIGLRAWERLKAASQGMEAPLTHTTMRRIERALFIQWLVTSLLIGTIFSFIFLSAGPADKGTALVFCFGLPALFFGANQLVRYLAETR
jgi:hypothetical protein